ATIPAFEVIRKAPGVVQSLTTQSPVYPGESGETDPSAYLAAAFDRYAALCAADDSCRALGDLRAAYRNGYEAYKAAPVTVVGASNDGDEHAVLIDGDRVASAVLGALSNTGAYALLAGAVAHAPSDEVNGLAAGSVLNLEPGALNPDFAWGAILSNSCSY